MNKLKLLLEVPGGYIIYCIICDSIWEVKDVDGILPLNLLFVQLVLGSQPKDENVI